jgi:hypothetical protein
LEASFIRAKPARVSVIQWGTPFSEEFRSTGFESGFIPRKNVVSSGTGNYVCVPTELVWTVLLGSGFLP